MKLNMSLLPLGIFLIIILVVSGCTPTAPEIVKITGINILEENQTMELGDEIQLTAIITPENATDKRIEWVSDDNNIAKVNETGMVNAISKGKTNITVITKDGDFSDTIKISVISQSTQPSEDDNIDKYIVDFITIEDSSAAKEISGVKINIFSDEERTNNVGNITTSDDGTTNIQLSNGEYWFTTSKDEYSEYKDNFTVSGSDLTIPTIYLSKVWKVTFVVAANSLIASNVDLRKNSLIKYGRSYSNNLPLKEVVITVYSDSEKTTDNKVASLTTNDSGIANISLPNGDYWFTAMLDTEAYHDEYHDENGMFSVSGENNNIIILMDPLCTITFDTNGGNDIPLQYVPAGDTATKPEDNPQKEGFNFTGWYEDANLAELFDFENTQITQDTTIYAGWLIKEYTVSFDINGCTTISSQTVKHGDKATRPVPDPTKNNYDFDDWYADETFNTIFDFENTQITQDMTIYAKWKAKACLATLQADINALKTKFPATGSGDEDWRNGDGKSYQLPSTTESGAEIAWNIPVAICPISGFDSSNAEIQFGYPITISPLGGISVCICSITAKISIGECSDIVTFNISTTTQTVEYKNYYSYSISAN